MPIKKWVTRELPTNQQFSILKALSESTDGIFSADFPELLEIPVGSIYIQLDRLEEKHLVNRSLAYRKRKPAVLFTITERGKIVVDHLSKLHELLHGDDHP